MPEPLKGRIGFDPPAYLHEQIFTLKEAAGVLGVPFDTLSYWLRTLRLLGFPLNGKSRNRRLMSGHAVYTAAVIATLQRVGITCGPQILVAAHGTTHPNNKPRLPFLMEKGHIAEGSAAIIEVDLSAIWIEIEPKLASLIEEDKSV
ncbi:helix-turn-helix domain-containing protein [Hoeflea sp. G2-23]|uniref:Helix-turn-helix domain-containing protein n=1 Tax=Hoeflea algicola TaxID=2983763 RepID=A0ABT3ZDI5_9HYPH|nr:MerR family transcriptional regulator [Hoeflea algicola]MCY0149859.1 helix-turn-helix domain-containing protein [Hoeflea algicola]